MCSVRSGTLSNQAKLFLMNRDGTDLQQLTFNAEEERAPAWSCRGQKLRSPL
jgi:Tol biopolymer transport system component